uniref:Uncharacterized protein n=1 Tax=Triticum urartu TaxID=4572 RepID=A0A8R7V5D7_TRIUA
MGKTCQGPYMAGLISFLDFFCCCSATISCSRKYLAKLACPGRCRLNRMACEIIGAIN